MARTKARGSAWMNPVSKLPAGTKHPAGTKKHAPAIPGWLQAFNDRLLACREAPTPEEVEALVEEHALRTSHFMNTRAFETHLVNFLSVRRLVRTYLPGRDLLEWYTSEQLDLLYK